MLHVFSLAVVVNSDRDHLCMMFNLMRFVNIFEKSCHLYSEKRKGKEENKRKGVNEN